MAKESLLSPGFRSAAAMAGWDEEALLLATLVVDDTPVRESRHKKRANPNYRTPPSSNTSRKRRSRKRASASIPALVLSLDDDDNNEKDRNKEKRKEHEKEAPNEEKDAQERSNSKEPLPSKLPCMDRLREELSCAICLEICYEPSTTPCGHSFCLKCIKNSTAKCGRRCPKCRELISNMRSCTINTVLWNTIQLLFPDEIQARKPTSPQSTSTSTTSQPNSIRTTNPSSPGGFVTASQLVPNNNNSSVRRRVQSEDATMAQRLQTEEYMLAFARSPDQQRSSSTFYSARANLRAMASRASRVVHIRYRNRPM